MSDFIQWKIIVFGSWLTSLNERVVNFWFSYIIENCFIIRLSWITSIRRKVSSTRSPKSNKINLFFEELAWRHCFYFKYCHVVSLLLSLCIIIDVLYGDGLFDLHWSWPDTLSNCKRFLECNGFLNLKILMGSKEEIIRMPIRRPQNKNIWEISIFLNSKILKKPAALAVFINDFLFFWKTGKKFKS